MLRRVDTSAFDVEGAGEEDAGIFGLPYGRDESTVVLVPVPWEPTTSYGRGAALGPAAILQASPQLDLYDPELAAIGLARPWVYGIHMLEPDSDIVAWNEEACERAAPVIERGGRLAGDPQLQADLDRVNALCRMLDARVEQTVGELADAGHLVGVVGGDHAAAFGAIAAAARRHPGLGILHIDAHADLRRAYEGFERSHASVMHNVLHELPEVETIVQVGIRDLSQGEAAIIRDDPRVTAIYDYALRRRRDDDQPWSQVCDHIVSQLPDQVYVSFDIDGLEPALCPGTGTPVPGGLSYGQVMTLLARLAERGKTVVGFDLVEVAPRVRHGAFDPWDGNVGARILYRLCGVALRCAGAHDEAP